MTSYLTKEYLISLFGAEEVEEMTDERFQLIFSSVSSRIDDAVRRYLPFEEVVPPILISIAVDIARYDIVADGRIYDEIKLNGLYRRYKDALSFLDAIRNGSVDLNNLNGLNLNIGIVGASFTSEPKRSFESF
jgi:phage gp36-like protein